jgi:catechol 2,3-dioxygenase-like lactoylglutathione lyase family enzyme
VSSALEDLAMMTYICFGTNALIRASRFYDATLGALGHKRYPPCGDEHHAMVAVKIGAIVEGTRRDLTRR